MSAIAVFWGVIKQREKWGRVKLRSRSMQPKNVMASYGVRAADKALTYSNTAGRYDQAIYT